MSSAAYLPILLFVAVGIAFFAVTLTFASLIRPARPDPVKESPYECGIEAEEGAWGRQSVHYYVIAVLFVIFDVEVVFLFPWAVQYRVLGLFGLVEMGIFLLILIVAYVYAWKKGALTWA
ncbi:MAG: NADH-quinone oxidoreductase subunit A [Acidobacteriota bacterium]|nr:NADH-quinone oxidoreductase subunit A [Acidobacteriota bacterium]